MTVEAARRLASPISVLASAHPLPRPAPLTRYLEGITLAEIADRAGIARGHRAAYRATLVLGEAAWEIPAQHWAVTKPHGGATVEIVPIVQSGAEVAIASALISAIAPVIAASLGWGATATALATAAISLVGMLAVNALIQPPEPDIGDTTPFYGIGAPANRVERYAPVAFPVGRHLSYPQPAATGYSETRDDRVIYAGLFVLGYGPLGVEQPRFGINALSDFDDVSLEFRNVDEAYSAPHMVGVNVVGYRGPEEPMTLYPGNIAQDSYQVTLDDPPSVIRRTRADTTRAVVVLHFPEGLFKSTKEGNDRSRTRTLELRYRQVGTPVWTALPPKTVKRRRRTAFSVEEEISFPSPGEYEIEITYLSDSDNDSVYDTCQLIAIRSERAELLPLNPDLAMVAVRIRASQQLSGGLDRLNFVLRQFARQWDGTAWTGYQPVEHPAWSYADALTGKSAGERAIPLDLIDGSSLKAWADAEPHWRCDLLVRGTQPIQQLLRTICAAGRARDTFYGTASGVVRETAGAPVEALLTPRNTYGFRAEHRKADTFHGIRVTVLSERLEWQEDEIVVYRDGYDGATASEFLDLTLTGTVVGENDEGLENVYRLARYFMAELLLRPELIQLGVDLTHLALSIGSKVRFQHDVRLNGVGSGRIAGIASGTGSTVLTLDERIETPPGSYRLSVWNSAHELTVTTASQDPADTRIWVTDTDIDDVIALDDLVVIERTQDAERDLIVTRIVPEEDGRATLYAVDAAPEILTADQGPVPPYDPGINTDRLGQEDGPALPEILGVRSDLGSALIPRPGAVPLPRIGIATRPPRAQLGQAIFVQLRWREEEDANWTEAAVVPYAPEVFTEPLEEGARYEVEVQFLDTEGRSRGYQPAGLVTAGVAAAFIYPPTGWQATPGIDTVTLAGDVSLNEDFAAFRVYGQVAEGQPEVFVAESRDPVIVVRSDPAQAFTGYVVREVLHTGALSAPSGFIPAVPTGVREVDLTAPLAQKLQDAEDAGQQALGQVQSIEEGLGTWEVLAAVTTPQGKVSELRIGTFLDQNGSGGAALTFDGSIVADGTIAGSALVITEFTGNIIKNGNFAFGDLRGWTFVETGHEVIERDLSSPRAAVVNAPLPYMLRLQGSGIRRFSVIEEEIALKDDGELSVSCDYVAVSPGTTTFRFRVSFYDAEGVFISFDDPPITTSSSTAWQTSARDVPIPAGTAKIRIDIGRYINDTGPDVLVSGLNVTKKRSAATVVTPGSVTTDLINTGDFNAAGFAVFGEGLQSANFATDDPVTPTTITGIKFTPDGPHYIGGGVFIDGETILLGTLKRRLFAAGELQTLLPTPFDARVLRQSVAGFQFDHPGFIEIILIGAGGSGAALHAGSRAYATGGGAGAVVRAFIEIPDTSGLYNVSLGLGGDGRSAPRGTTLNGLNGGNSFFTGPGLNLVANGGFGGRFALSPLTQMVNGGTGGAASGGFENWIGGRGGRIGPGAAANSALATGGGSINAGLIEGAPNAIDILTVQSTSRNVIEESPGGFPLTQFLREMKLAPFGPMYYDDTNWTGAPGRYLRDGGGKSVPGFGRPYGSGSGGVAIHDGASNIAIADSRAGGNAICFIYYHTGRPL